MVDNIPFNVVNPAANTRGVNVVVLKGGTGFAKGLPQRVEFPVGTAAKKLYVLGGVAGWGFPYGDPDVQNVPAAKARIEYADGQSEEIGSHFSLHGAIALSPPESDVRGRICASVAVPTVFGVASSRLSVNHSLSLSLK